jgi:hypothetical protein
MQQKPMQELVGGDGHFPLLAAVGVVLPPKGDLAVGQPNKTMVENGYPVRVSRQVVEHMLRATEGRLGINHPILAEQFPQECTEGLFPLQRFETAGEEKFSFSKSALPARHERAAENTAEYLDWQEEGVARMDPPLAVPREAAGRNHTVNVRVVLEILPPRVEHTEETDLRPQMLGIGCHLQQGLRAGLKQQLRDDLLIVECQPRQLLRPGEDDMEIADVEQFFLSISQRSRALVRHFGPCRFRQELYEMAR